MARLEHLNFTVSDPRATAGWIARVFDWKIRWEGPGMQTGYTIHIGGGDASVELFSFGDAQDGTDETYRTTGGLNHWAVVVDDLDATEKRIKSEGFETMNHGDYEPGRRFYFRDADGIECEVVSYS